jgi:environmental stress-induced protein Ves
MTQDPAMPPPAPPISRLAADAHRDMPWRNGLGRTAEIARHPASGDGFDWRVSIATITSDGPFSAFPGCDRLLVPIAGAGLELVFPDGAIRRADLFTPLRFGGDTPCDGRLLGPGPTRDLNVITRRDTMEHRVEIVTAPCRWVAEGKPSFVIALAGGFTVATEDGRWRLDTGDALRIDATGVALRLMAIDPEARAALVTLRRIGG